MKVIIAGGRNFNDYETLRQFCDKALHEQTEVEIVSGTANGADKLGERYANDRGYPIKQFPAEWGKFGRNAGFKRNTQMAEYANALIVFWDGKSSGTKHMIDVAKRSKLKVDVISF